MSVVMGTCDRLHVLDSGRTVIEGAPAAVRSDPQVIEIYFGKRH
ncbi:Branched-chain amino acid transport ATP-binding protein LivG [Pimelobacter simplex]|uniref:Branched-chain amino acid transport ATP-binding protein LivG n=2 Tax=Nocardioides simplex TaxID=2045 RepID=A0A0A1DSV4_NOCSI|nr:Branched-chain amino acid transport ATP-binding protein LivG [Pimelobacter simplex]